MEKSIRRIYKYIDDNAPKFLRRLQRIIRQRSESAANVGIKECAELIRRTMDEIGIKASLLQLGESNPAVYGEISSRNSKKTLLFYNHYDVQSPEPLDQWTYPPYSGQISQGRIYGRGASDNKGDLVARICAAEACLRILNDVPVNLKFFVEGEEEIGSPHLVALVKNNKKLLKADGALWEGGGVDEAGRPVLKLGVKGVLDVELKARGASTDVHALYGSIVPNPAWRLIWAANTIKNQKGEILIRGFHGDIKSNSTEFCEKLRKIPFDEDEKKRQFGLDKFLSGLTGYQLKKAFFGEPSCTVCGFDSGYRGPGMKTVLPGTATMKIDFRLVPDQKPNDIFEKLKLHLKDNGFEDLELVKLATIDPARTEESAEIVQVSKNVQERFFKREAVIWPINPGSGPLFVFRKILSLSTASAGVGYPGSKVHAPNENITLDGFMNGIKIVAGIMCEFGSK